jgi:hypothetical protein
MSALKDVPPVESAKDFQGAYHAWKTFLKAVIPTFARQPSTFKPTIKGALTRYQSKA